MVINGHICDHVTKYFCKRIHFKLVRKIFCNKRVKKAAPRAYVMSYRNGEEGLWKIFARDKSNRLKNRKIIKKKCDKYVKSKGMTIHLAFRFTKKI